MNVILLEKVQNLGGLGDAVKVKNGYARNYLLPKGIAAMATKANLAKFEEVRAELEKKAQEVKRQAEARRDTFADVILTIEAKVTEEGQLFGSVSTREISEAAEAAGHKIDKSEIDLPNGPIQEVGEYDIHVHLDSDVTAMIKVHVVAEA